MDRQLIMLVARMQLQTMKLLLASSKQDEWKNGDPSWVNRGKDGRFGRTGASLSEAANVTSSTIQMLIEDKDFRERAGLAAGAFGAKLLKKVVGLGSRATRLDGIIAESEARLGLESVKIPELPKNADLATRLEYSIARYKALQEAIAKTPEAKDKGNALAKAIKASIPVVANIAMAVGPAVAVSLVEKGDLESLLASTSASVAASLATEKALDVAQIEDPKVRAAIRLAVSTAAAYAAIGVDNKLADKIPGRDMTPTANVGRALGIKASEARKLAGVLSENGVDAGEVFKVIERNKDLHLIESDVPVTDRLKEIKDLSGDPDKKIGIEWRLGIVKSEVKYGGAINKLLKADPADVVPQNKTVEDWIDSIKNFLSDNDTEQLRQNPEMLSLMEQNTSGYGAAWSYLKKWQSPPEAENSYQEFFSLLQSGKTKNEQGADVIVLPNEHEKMEEVFAKQFFVSRFIDSPYSFVASPNSLNEASEQAKLFTSVVKDPPSNVHIVSTPVPSGFPLQTATPFVLNFNNNSYIDIGNSSKIDDLKEIVFHEMGHVVEVRKKLSPFTWNYIDNRRDSGKTLPYAYSTLKYSGAPGLVPPNSEVISTVTQMLDEAKDLHRIASIDRDHLMFGLWALDR